ncbi:hypothetical protein ACO2Q3_20690 [Caulobacter sp. KR2-114]|uniref:hypothetical protein n=1 Tax=Caulobacter sp. KR2-114 TaxID=3400912 RepID=UPI003C02B934
MRSARAEAGLAVLVALAVAGCGRSAAPRTDSAAGPKAPVAAPAGPIVGAVPADLSPPPDPATDSRPDAVKLEDAASRLQALQDRLGTDDAQLIAGVRTALQGGRQDDARTVISRYVAALAAEAAVTPAPKATGCHARALAPLQQAADALARERADRTAKAQAMLALNYRPLTLADLAPLAPGQAPDPAAQAVADALARARAQTAACAAAPPPARPRPPRAAYAPEPYPGRAPMTPSAPAQPASAPSAASPAAAPAGASPAPAAKPHKTLLERIFGGGHHDP